MVNIVLSGGPGSGKSTSISKIEATLTARGYKVLIVPESATELILNGIFPCDNISLEQFQEFVLDKQLGKEKMYEEVGKFFDTDKVVLILDRGIGDQLAYIDKSSVEQMLDRRGLTMSNAIGRYDLVFHLVTAADGAEEHYEWAGSGNICANQARSESPEEARTKDKRTLNGWIQAGCQKLKVIDNSTDFNTKINRVLIEIFNLLGEPVPSEIERKYLIKRPSSEVLDSIDLSSKSHIIQTYLKRKTTEIERRVRQRGSKETGFMFYSTEKTDAGLGERIEIDHKISDREYINLLSEADTSLHQISKERYCFVYNTQFFELDIYPFSDEYAILEIELTNINNPVDLPPFLNVVKDVTDDKTFKNYSISKDLKLIV